MSNLPLVPGILLSIEDSPKVTVTKLSIKRTRQVTQKYGALGAIGTAVGPYKVAANFTLAVPVSGLEVDIDDLSNRPGGFSLTFSKGARRYRINGCQVNEDGIDNDPENANTENQLSIVGTEMLRIA